VAVAIKNMDQTLTILYTMKRGIFYLGYLFPFILASCSGTIKDTNPILDIEGGRVKGVYIDSTQVIVWKGIPWSFSGRGMLSSV
jgi:hypothetical protein